MHPKHVQLNTAAGVRSLLKRLNKQGLVTIHEDENQRLTMDVSDIDSLAEELIMDSEAS